MTDDQPVSAAPVPLFCPHCGEVMPRPTPTHPTTPGACMSHIDPEDRETIRQPRDEMVAERLEDLAWLADTGENAVGAARRLGVSHAALDRWCRRHCFDLWQQLRARDPKPLDQMAAATVEARRKVDA